MGRTRLVPATSVFFNCPYDDDYWPIFEAVLFTIVACGFRPRSAMEELDSGRVRLEKLQSIIQACVYGIHDLSRVELGPATALPRFNMAFELGLDIAASMFGSGRLKRKRYLILDSEPHRYKQSISDISGLDIQCHRHSPDAAITAVRNWLRAVSRRSDTPGPVELRRRYETFVAWLPRYCVEQGFDRDALLFVEYVGMAKNWLAGDFVQGEASIEAGFDPLTGLANRPATLHALEKQVQIGRRSATRAPALLVVDVDGLDRVNQHSGHLAGDVVLRDIAVALQGASPPSLVGRLGADEFLVVSPGLRTEELFELAETFRRKVAGRSFLVLDKRVRVTISIGVVPAASTPTRSVDEMVEAGHLAVLRAKAAGGNRVELAEQADDGSVLR